MKRQEVLDCLLCNNPINEGIDWKRLFSNSFAPMICPLCEEKFEMISNENDPEVFSLYRYNEAMQDYLHRYKFMHDVLLAKVFRKQIFEYLHRRTEKIVPIPMHPVKLKERTFQHVDELLKQANISYVHYLEKNTKESQGGKSREERLKTPQIFRLKENVCVENEEILLIDDIYTTGTTIRHAKQLLLHAGAKSVKAFTLIKV